MTLPVERPVLQNPPAEYDQEYMKHMTKQLELFFQRLNAAGAIQATTINLSKIPSITTAHTLRTGDLYESEGDVFVVKDSVAHISPIATVTGAVGTVTTTP